MTTWRHGARAFLILALVVAAAGLSGTVLMLKPTFADRRETIAPEPAFPPPPLLAQNAPPAHKPAPHPAPPAPKGQSTAQPSPVSLEQALYLIRSTLLTLNDANRSGNYTVLRDLAAPSFQANNTAADLGTIFGDLRRRHVDLFAVALMAPQLAAAPALDDKGMLRLSGHVPTQPLQIRFDLLFQNVDNQWRLFGISVQTPETAPQANIPPATR
jgi:hypothetical protein